MKRSPLEGASNRLTDDANKGVMMWSGSRRKYVDTSFIEHDTELLIFLGNKEVVDCAFSMFVEGDHSRPTGLVHKFTFSSSASHQCGLREGSDKTQLGTEEFSLFRVTQQGTTPRFSPRALRERQLTVSTGFDPARGWAASSS